MALPYRVALVGYGLAGKVFHAPLIAATPGLVLHCVVSRDPAKVHADWPDVRVYPDLGAMLADPAVDLVVIATPDALHAAQAEAAIAAGKAVVIDKPFALRLADAERLCALAAARGTLLSVFHNRRWDGDFLTLRALIEQGALGKITLYESHFDRFRPVVEDRWREQAGAGIWPNLGPHLVDQALVLFGMPHAVSADLTVLRPGGVAPDHAHVQLLYPDLRVILHASMAMPLSTLRFAVHGLGGSFRSEGLDVQEGQSRAGMTPLDAGWGVAEHPASLYRAQPDATVRVEPVPLMRGAYPDYYAGICAALAGDGPNPVTAQSALDTMRVMDAAERSAAEGRVIPCPADSDI